jgi:hypothetical protein
LAVALEIQFPKEEDRYKIPANCVQAVDYILSVDVAKLVKQRQAQVNRFEQLTRKLVSVLIEAMDYPDKKLPLQLLEGLPFCGDIDYDSGVYRPNPQEEDAGVFKDHFEEWKTSHDVWFTECSTQLEKAAGKAKSLAIRGDRTSLDTLHKIERATKLEVEKGLMGPSLTEQELRSKYESNGP